jgi:N utilization substance protein B
MKRRRSREYALQFLYRTEFVLRDQLSLGDELKAFWEAAEETDLDIRDFADELVQGALSHRSEIDNLIQTAAEKWALLRMAAVDRNILRLAAYEILYRKDIPPAVTIDEALEIAKKYSTAESAAFINGILDRIAKDLTLRGAASQAETEQPQ